MATPYDELVGLITQRPTSIPGLKYFPDLEPTVSNDQDMPPFGWVSSVEVTDCNLAVMRQVVGQLGSNLSAALEIGVNRNGDRSMSRIIMDSRPQGSYYLGIDIEDKSYLDDPDNNTWTIRCSSDDRPAVMGKLQERGVEKLDLIMIDGWHSVNMCVNDWHYTELLSDHGIVILHDTNSHPGCVALFDAVDENLWIKERFCTNSDFGIATFKRRI